MPDGCVCAYNILPTAGSSAGAIVPDETKSKISAALKGRTSPKKGRKLSEETKAKMAAAKTGRQGENTPRFNTGKTVFLYTVCNHGLDLVASFPNNNRAGEHLGVDRTTLFRYIKNRTLFKVNGLPHIVSAAGLAIIYSRRPTGSESFLNFPPPLLSFRSDEKIPFH